MCLCRSIDDGSNEGDVRSRCDMFILEHALEYAFRCELSRRYVMRCTDFVRWGSDVLQTYGLGM